MLITLLLGCIGVVGGYDDCHCHPNYQYNRFDLRIYIDIGSYDILS
jgi:hypothetical protein